MDLQRLTSYIRRAVNDYGMIKRGDRIAVGLSGGKDSAALLTGLAKLQEFIPEKFDLCAVTVSLGFTGEDYTAAVKLCATLGVGHSIINTDIGSVVFEGRKEKNPCSLCSNMRKGALYNEAVRLGCNTVALGHNRDDVIETFFMSLFYGGSIHCFAPVTYLSGKELYAIRPLIYAPERDIKSFIKKQGIAVVHNPCLANGNTVRRDMKGFIKEMSPKYQSFEENIFGAIKRSGISGWDAGETVRIQEKD